MGVIEALFLCLFWGAMLAALVYLPFVWASATLCVGLGGLLYRCLSAQRHPFVGMGSRGSMDATNEASALGRSQRPQVKRATGRRYWVRRELGEMGLSTVYLGVDRTEGLAPVLIKVLPVSVSSRLGSDGLDKAIRAAAGPQGTLPPPLEAPTSDVGKTETSLYYVTPLEEPPKMDRFKRPWSPYLLLALVAGAAGGFAAYELVSPLCTFGDDCHMRPRAVWTNLLVPLLPGLPLVWIADLRMKANFRRVAEIARAAIVSWSSAGEGKSMELAESAFRILPYWQDAKLRGALGAPILDPVERRLALAYLTSDEFRSLWSRYGSGFHDVFRYDLDRELDELDTLRRQMPPPLPGS